MFVTTGSALSMVILGFPRPLTEVSVATARLIPVVKKCRPIWKEAIEVKTKSRVSRVRRYLSDVGPTVGPSEPFPVEQLEVETLVTVLGVYQVR